MPGPHEPTDPDLIRAANRGNAAAFAALYDRYHDWVTSLAFRLTGDHAAALDVMQETFLYLLRKFPGFVLTAQMKTLLYPVVSHLARDARRKTDRARGASTDALGGVAAEDDRAGASRADLARVLAALGEGSRETLLLRFVDGLPLAEIAQAMDVPVGTVKSRLSHALAVLREDEEVRKFFDR